jgi:hypothetical protein
MPLKKVSKPLEKIFGLPSLSSTFQFPAQLTKDTYADLSKKIELTVTKNVSCQCVKISIIRYQS